MNEQLADFAETEERPHKPYPKRLLALRAFALSEKAPLLGALFAAMLLTGIACVSFGFVRPAFAMPLTLPLFLLLFLTYRKIVEMRDQADHLSREVVHTSEQYQILTTNLAAAIIIRDGTGNLLFCSPFTEVLTGYSRQEIYDQGEDLFAKIIHEDDRELYRRAQKVTAYGEAFQYRLRLFHKSGIEMWAESRTVPILDETGVVTSSLSVLIDITGTALYQKQVEEMNRDMQDFSYMISHDLKAPIATIKGMLTVLQEEQNKISSVDSQEAIAHIDNATKRLELLVGAVLEYSRLSNTTTEREPTTLASIFKEISTDFGPALKAVGGTLLLPEQSVTILGDHLRVYQIFSNLVGNAIKYRDSQRTLKIEISISTAHASRWVTVSVKDNGIGIPAEKQNDVFRPFYRAHAAHAEGAGVGLASVKKIAEKLGGQISLASTVGSGTEFTIKFLRAPE